MRLTLVVLLLAATALAARAAEPPTAPATIRLGVVFPGADRMGAESGVPPAAPAFKDGKLVGYVLSSRKVVASTGFSGKPLDIAIGLTLDGRIAGAQLLSHQEPILVIGVPGERLEAFVARFRGADVRRPVRIGGRRRAGSMVVDGISGATVTSVVIRDAILRSARIVARGRGILAGPKVAGQGARLNLDVYEPAGWTALMQSGAIARLRLTNRMVDEKFRGKGAAAATPGDPAATFIELYIGVATPALVGRNLLGDALYNRLMAQRRPGEQLLFVAARGLYSFKGTSYIRTGVFDRVRVVQGARTMRLRKEGHRRLETLRAAGAPELRELAVFTLPANSGLDPARPLRLELLVTRPGTGDEPVRAAFALPYKVPARLLTAPARPGAAAAAAPGGRDATPLWQQIWQRRAGEIALLVLFLVGLIVVLFLQDVIVRAQSLYNNLRLFFLIFTVAWLGYAAGGQLSVVNTLTFAQALLTDFRWELFLLDPIIFILWCFVAVTMLFWGRGVYCGWLCPFGALQDILNQVARAFRVPQVAVPFALHERLWPVKYVIFLGLLGLSLSSMTYAVTGAEVEPFKTAITLKFVREWGFVLYAGALLLAGIFIERFFCRYLCPLGAALAIPARLRMFEWLKRRPECGTVCQACAVSCPVQAIHPLGNINPNECIYCLSCQVIHYDDDTCPPLIERRKRRERRAALGRPRQDAAAAEAANPAPKPSCEPEAGP